MRPDLIHGLSVREIGDQYRRGTLKPSQALAYFLDRIDRIDPVLNAIVSLDRAEAQAAAAASDARYSRGEPLGPLDGIPVAIKDSLLAAGQPATWGSAVYRDFIPDEDELPVALLREAGAVITGKTNVPEFTLTGNTTNPLHGTTANPWDLSLTPGGSSGGSAAAVAAGLVPLALGTDGGGSIRRPAGYTGLVGLKTSTGRVPRSGGMPMFLYDCEVVAPLARRVDDLQIALSVLARPRRLDQRSRIFPTLSETAGPVAPLRILFVDRLPGAPVDPFIVERCADAVAVLERLGHRITRGELPFPVEEINRRWAGLADTGLDLIARRHGNFAEAASRSFVERAAAGARMKAADYLDLVEMLFAFRSEVGAGFGQFDIIATPTAAAMPWDKTVPVPAEIDGEPVGPKAHAVFSIWVNAAGHPAISVPVEPVEGIPVGIQFVGDFGADQLLLDLAAQFETARPWAQRWPDVATV